MKKYDKVIFVPDDEYGHYEVKLDKDDKFKPQRYSPHFNVIVLTVEEALEMWNAGRYRAINELGVDTLSKVTAPNFREFLQSKGINIQSL